MGLCFTIWLKLRARPSPLWDSRCLGVGGVFNFALAQNAFYQNIHISNMIVHIKQAICKWPNRETAKSGDRAIQPGRRNETWPPLTVKRKTTLKKLFPCNILEQTRLNTARLALTWSPPPPPIIKTFTIVPLIKPHRGGVGLINTSYSGDYCLFSLHIDSKHPGSIVM